MWASRHFRPYLYGRKFIVRTDHHALRWLHNFKEPAGQVARWLEQLAEFDYEMVHRQGKQHTNADALSRGMCKQCGWSAEEEDDSEPSVLTCQSLSSSQLLPVWTAEELMEHQVADADISQVVAWLKSEKFPVQCPSTQSWKLKSLWSQRSCPLLRDGILYRRWEYIPNGGVCKRLQLVLPSSLISSILSGMHDSLVGGGGGGIFAQGRHGRKCVCAFTGPVRGRMWPDGAATFLCATPGSHLQS